MIHNSIQEQVLSEAYFGKHADLLKCEEHLEKIRLEALAGFNGIHANVTPSMLKEMKEVEKLLGNLFGFKEAIIELKAMGYANAYTILTRFNIDDIAKDFMKKNKRINDGKTIKFTAESNKTLYCICGLEMFTLSKLTAGEYLAVILHEIGHNFYYDDRELSAAYRLTSSVFIMKDILMELQSDKTRFLDKIKLVQAMTAFVPSGDKIRIAAANYIRGNKQLHDLSLAISNFKGAGMATMTIFAPFLFIYLHIKYFARVMTGIITRAAMSFASLPMFALAMFANGDNYQNEKFADNFTTAFGYGYETITGQKKLDLGKVSAGDGIKYPTKGTTAAFQLLTLPTDIIETTSKIVGFLGYVHPNSITRCKDQLKYLKAHQKTVTDPRMKKLLAEDMKQCEKELKGLEELYIKSNMDNRKYASALYYQVSAMIGGDFKEYLPTHMTKDNHNYRQMETSKSLQKK